MYDARCDAGIYEQRLIVTRQLSTFVRINLRSGAAQQDRHDPALDESALTDLLTALRVWMPRGLSRGERRWAQRAQMCRSAVAGVAFDEVRGQCAADARRIVR